MKKTKEETVTEAEDQAKELKARHALLKILEILIAQPKADQERIVKTAAVFIGIKESETDWI